MKRALKKFLFITIFIGCCGTAFAASDAPDSVSVNYPALDYKNPKRYNLKDIKVRGVKMISPELIVNSVGLTRGDSVYLPGDYISNALQLLWSQRYYSNIKAYVDIDGDDAFLTLDLKERPRVSTWNIEGVSSGEKKELREDKMKLRTRSEFSDFAIKNSTDIIKRYLGDKGYLNAEVEVTTANDTVIDNFVVVTFHIKKNKKVKIGEIVIEGNQKLPSKKIKGAMKKTHERNLINVFKGTKFKDAEFENDKDLIIDYMQSKGYRDAYIVSDSIYNISDNRMGIKLVVNEGKKYYIRDIKWVGNTKYPTEQLEQIFGIKKGDVYDRKNMSARLGTDGGAAAAEGEINVSALYLNNGYLTYSIEPVETVVSGDSIDIELRMVEGKQFTVNEVIITGNTRTNDRVVRREIPLRPGELYDQSMLINSIRLIGSMGHFDQTKIQPDIMPVSDELVNIGLSLEETASDQFEVSGGWGGGMFVASVGIQLNNVSLRKFFDKHAWRPYPAGDNQQLAVRVQTNGAYYQAVSLSFMEPWLGGKKPNSLSASFYFSSESDAYNIFRRVSNKRFRTIGATIGLGKRLSWPDPYFQIMGELSYQAYNLKNWDYFIIKNGQCNTITLAGTLSRNSLDAPIYTTRGSEMSFKLAATPPYSLFDKRDFSSSSDISSEKRYKWIEYYKINAKARWFFPMLPNNKLVLMTSAEFGYLGHYSPNRISPFEGFNMGGDGVSGYSIYGVQEVGMRGYEEGSLTPLANGGRQARAYIKYTAELRYPIVMEPSSTVYALIFGEAGNAFSGWKEINPFDLKRSVGVGLRLYLPIVGMFGIDWGWGFDRVPGSTKKGNSKFSFSIGNNF